MTTYIAILESPNFNFTAKASSESEARANLIRGLKRHGKEYRLAKNWYVEYDISIIFVEEDGCTRDYQPI